MTPWYIARATTALGLSCALAAYLTPIIRRGAQRFGVLDHPVGPHKTHAAPVAYLGGIAVYLAYLLTLSVVFTFDVELLGTLLAGTLMAMLGLFDDLRVLPATLKLLGQLVAAWVLYRCGLHIKLAFLPGWATAVCTLLWLVGATNAVNILDVSDGLATVCAAVAALALAAIGLGHGQATLTVTALALCGALLGYLPANWAPASIYLGDTGSLFVGFTLAALSLAGSYTGHSVWGALAPVGFLVVPLLDLALVCTARLRAGLNPMHASPDHLALRLRAAGWSARAVGALGGGLSTAGAAWGLALTQATGFAGAMLALGGVGAFLGLGCWLYLKPAPPRRAPAPRHVRAEAQTAGQTTETADPALPADTHPSAPRACACWPSGGAGVGHLAHGHGREAG